MEEGLVPKDERLFFTVVSAVRTPIARRLWNSGDCDLPPRELAYGTTAELEARMAEEVENTQQRLSETEQRMRTAEKEEARQAYAKESAELREQIQQLQRLSKAARDQPGDQPASELLYTIDMNPAR